MDLSDGVIVTGPGLHDLFKDRTDRPRFILENQMPIRRAPGADFKPTGNRLGGSMGHLSDLLAVSPVLRDLLEKHPALTLAVMGNAALPDLLPMPVIVFATFRGRDG